jgi:hypothetical protein
MTCAACGGELFQFQAGGDIKEAIEHLPTVCRKCGEVRVKGERVAFPALFQAQAAMLADEAAQAAVEARKALYTDQHDLRIDRYFANVYRKGYLHGFFRALVFFQYQAKEGRLSRLRKLWRSFRFCFRREEKDEIAEVVMSMRDLREFDQLINLGHKEIEDAASSQDDGAGGDAG